MSGGIIYWLCAMGCASGGWPAWKAIVWPYWLGRMIARRAQDGEGG